ncbi:threonine/serine exporter family protein [Lactobacillus delbrueckii subsp. lactis]|uniref:threonine/serine exporter family protein n=1 Tax=Lactobacillus delbrueckii TaxID=1584 RepID=UPI0004AC3C3F|nr:threonine/serine exporter family protein [Lactobacillus delbrueckii]MCD5507062.1 threonine/serine exporter family protein [Lactobacillus delbrueckii subsp. lactis]MCD5520316.1 threonine/serine exporter family protein [Lactobacillus delbrueckii subsp. lactis]MCD5524146.1 threonine/serine exporter family protein [Lactobacillus delbrueckii subsp. lactis]MCD5525422.1 threonine/serine exporter family protein [Lactobacillus delbrueckii subsp. lactis]MCT3483795.1 threonine/serine exporter [Lactoba
MLGMQVSFNIWDVLINLIFSYIATVGFALTVNIPHRVIHWSGICGCAGWLVTEASGGRMISNTLGAFAVGLVAVVLAKWKKCPVTLFSVPGRVPLVPGAPAYMVVRRLIDGKYIAAQQMMMRVAIVTVSIALGFLLSTLFQEAWNKYIKRLKLREKLKK